MSITQQNTAVGRAEQNNLSPIPHALERWNERTQGSPVKLTLAWQKSLEVDAPNVDGNARLYPPEDMLIVERDGVIKTVLNADYGRLDAMSYVKCDECGCFDDPLVNVCTWCNKKRQIAVMGGMTISRGGMQ